MRHPLWSHSPSSHRKILPFLHTSGLGTNLCGVQGKHTKEEPLAFSSDLWKSNLPLGPDHVTQAEKVLKEWSEYQTTLLSPIWLGLLKPIYKHLEKGQATRYTGW